jgi:hypothetical protein
MSIEAIRDRAAGIRARIDRYEWREEIHHERDALLADVETLLRMTGEDVRESQARNQEADRIGPNQERNDQHEEDA